MGGRHLAAALGLVAGLLLPAAPLNGVAASPGVQQADPVVGPNARDEAQHSHDQLHLTPATGSPHPALPQRGRVFGPALPQGGMVYGPAAPAPANTNPAGGVDREVFGFAPYWAIANNSQWNYSLLTTVAYFGLDINSDGSIK